MSYCPKCLKAWGLGQVLVGAPQVDMAGPHQLAAGPRLLARGAKAQGKSKSPSTWYWYPFFNFTKGFCKFDLAVQAVPGRQASAFCPPPPWARQPGTGTGPVNPVRYLVSVPSPLTWYWYRSWGKILGRQTWETILKSNHLG